MTAASLAPDMRRLYSRVANFPKKVNNLRAKIAAMRDEAKELGFREEARQLAAMSVFADVWPSQRPQKRNDWSDDETLTLKRLWIEGVSGVEIGERMGRTAPAVRKQARKLGLPKRRRAAVQ
jgi:hypothetical protein